MSDKNYNEAGNLKVPRGYPKKHYPIQANQAQNEVIRPARRFQGHVLCLVSPEPASLAFVNLNFFPSNLADSA